jgi:glycosyltransferase involved in cell wall biosynthesis
VPAAAFIALASRVPVILHTHAYVKAPSGALPAAFRRQELRPLSGFAFVSDYALNHFRGNFPHVSPPMRAVPNGLDMANWRCPTSKEKMILSVGRALKGKGHIEAMGAIARVLSSRPDWKARFILADAAAADLEPQTVQALRDAAAVFGRRVRIDSNVPYADVKAAWESAAIGMVLTRGPEPFGRTALEALASGAALITSGLGGLAEVCGPCAVRVDPGDADALAAALGALIDAPDRRADLARAGRKRVEALFDIRTAAGRMDDFIDACIGERRAGTKAPVAFHSRNG